MTFSRLKKLEFHDHLDGSLRPLTVWEEAQKNGVNIACLTGETHPTPESTEKWLKSAAASRNLNSFLEKFALTTAVLQTEESLFRAARETVHDWHAVNTVYGETRFAPENHTAGGLSEERAVEAVAAGLKAGSAETGVRTGLILCAMRQNCRSRKTAELCLKRQDLVCGFDLAGPERGFPVTLHEEAFRLLREAGFRGITCHAGEDANEEAVSLAVEAGALRVGHAAVFADQPLRERLRERLIECCLTSNEATRAVSDIRCHPVKTFFADGIPFLLCCDDRLMCNTDLNREYARAADAFGWDESVFIEMNRRAVDFAFGLTEDEKTRLKAEIGESVPSDANL